MYAHFQYAKYTIKLSDTITQKALIAEIKNRIEGGPPKKLEGFSVLDECVLNRVCHLPSSKKFNFNMAIFEHGDETGFSLTVFPEELMKRHVWTPHEICFFGKYATNPFQDIPPKE